MDISIVSIKKNISHFLHRYHVMLFTVVVLGGLAVAIFILNTIIARSGQSDNYTPAGSNLSFDQETIDRVGQLKSRDEANQTLELPPGRTNPFVE